MLEEGGGWLWCAAALEKGLVVAVAVYCTLQISRAVLISVQSEGGADHGAEFRLADYHSSLPVHPS